MKIPLLHRQFVKQLTNEVHLGINRRKMHAVFHVSGHATSQEKSVRGRTIELSNRLLFVFGHGGVTKVSWGSDTFTTDHYNLSALGFPRKLAEGAVALFTFPW